MSATATRYRFSSSREQAPQMHSAVEWKFQRRQMHWKLETMADKLFETYMFNFILSSSQSRYR